MIVITGPLFFISTFPRDRVRNSSNPVSWGEVFSGPMFKSQTDKLYDCRYYFHFQIDRRSHTQAGHSWPYRFASQGTITNQSPQAWYGHSITQWVSTFLMLQPLNQFLMLGWPPKHNIILLLLHDCNFATDMNHNVNIWYATPVKGLLTHHRLKTDGRVPPSTACWPKPRSFVWSSPSHRCSYR